MNIKLHNYTFFGSLNIIMTSFTSRGPDSLFVSSFVSCFSHDEDSVPVTDSYFDWFVTAQVVIAYTHMFDFAIIYIYMCSGDSWR